MHPIRRQPGAGPFGRLPHRDIFEFVVRSLFFDAQPSGQSGLGRVATFDPVGPF